MAPRRCNALAVLLCLGLAPAAAVAAKAPAHIVVDAQTGSVLNEAAATHRWHPASLTKLMTIFLALEAVADGRVSLNEALSISAAAANQSEFKLGLQQGKTILVREAILAVLQRSANDAATLLAERVAGSESAFAERMTAKARALGMTGTQFRNATGLPDPAQVTTARDMAVLARAILDRFPQYADLFAAPGFSMTGSPAHDQRPAHELSRRRGREDGLHLRLVTTSSPAQDVRGA
jgi:D-alanyl-D-alanine carboxypeptidase